MLSFGGIFGRRLFPKIVIAFLIVIIPIGGLSLLMNQSGESIVRQELLQSSSSNVHFFLSALETEINRIKRVEREYVSQDDDFQKAGVIPESLDDFERAQTIVRIENKLSILKSSSPYIEDIKIYFPKLGATIRAGNLGDTIPQQELDAIKRGTNHGSSPFIYYQNRLLLGMVYPAFGQASFAIEVELSLPLLRQSLSQMSNQESSGTILMNESGNWAVDNTEKAGILTVIRALLAQSSTSGVISDQRRISMDDRPYLLYFERSSELGLTLIHYVPENQVMGALKQYQTWYWVLAAASLAVVIVFSNLIFFYIHQPMRRLVNGLRQVGKGNLAIRLQHKSRDEFQDVYHQFNTMASRIQTLIGEVTEQKLHSQRSELKQLQSQINPHFLYNCLFILLTLIRQEDLASAEHLVKHLGNYFRFVTRNGEDEVTLEKEIFHAQAYAGIQSVRFPDIQVDWRPFPANSLRIMVPRLILQPILENAYLHGLEQKEGIGKLVVEAEEEDGSLSIRIMDNGMELDEAALRELSDRLDANQEIRETTGIFNVHRRLQLKFGKAYGMKLERAELGGLLVTLRIPPAE